MNEKHPDRDMTAHTGGRLTFAVSMTRVNLLHVEDEVRQLEAAGCDELHFRITDGTFVPGFTFGADWVRSVKAASKLPCTVHLMIGDPDAYLGSFVDAGADTIIVPAEAPHHLHRTLSQVRDLGPAVGVSLNPATPLTALEYVLPLVDRVLVMAADAGFKTRLVDNAFERVRILRENIAYHERRVMLEVDGGLNARNTATFARMGAAAFVLDALGIPEGDIAAGLGMFKSAVAQQRHLV